MPPLRLLELFHVSVGELEYWEYCPARRMVMLRAVVDGACTDADVTVATEAHPRFGARIIKRHDSGVWEITPLRCGSDYPKPIHPRIGLRSVLLLRAPPEVQTELILTT